jgi:hypothetical protein
MIAWLRLFKHFRRCGMSIRRAAVRATQGTAHWSRTQRLPVLNTSQFPTTQPQEQANGLRNAQSDARRT